MPQGFDVMPYGFDVTPHGFSVRHHGFDVLPHSFHRERAIRDGIWGCRPWSAKQSSSVWVFMAASQVWLP